GAPCRPRRAGPRRGRPALPPSGRAVPRPRSAAPTPAVRQGVSLRPARAPPWWGNGAVVRRGTPPPAARSGSSWCPTTRTPPGIGLWRRAAGVAWRRCVAAEWGAAGPGALEPGGLAARPSVASALRSPHRDRAPQQTNSQACMLLGGELLDVMYLAMSRLT